MATTPGTVDSKSEKQSARCCGIRTIWWKLLGAIFIVVAGVVLWQRLKPGAAEGIDPTLTSSGKSPVSQTPDKKIIKGSITDILNEHPIEEAEHVLDPLLIVAEKGLEKLRSELVDYSAVITRQERVGSKLMEPEQIFLKIRQPQVKSEGQKKVARAIYTKHLAPKRLKDQQAIWVDGKNDNKLIAKPAPPMAWKRMTLKVDSSLAMMGNRYPMTEAGFEVLIQRMLEKGRRDRNHGDCEVEVDRFFEIDGRDCTLFTIRHPVKKEPFDFHIAQIAIDDKLNLPIFYPSKDWPQTEGGPAPLLERYKYTDIKINPGFTDIDFDTKNKEYKFPRW